MIDVAELAECIERVAKELIRWCIIVILASGGLLWLQPWRAA